MLRILIVVGGFGLALTVIFSPANVYANKFHLVYTFTGGNDGGEPTGALIRGKAGYLYGTACAGGGSGYGAVFKLSPDGTETVLYSFAGYPNDGACPNASLIMDRKGDLYGTTYGSSNCKAGCGTVFRLRSNNHETVLHAFTGEPDGAGARGGLIRINGNLYGTTEEGGAKNLGTVFRVTPNGTETVLHSFGQNNGDGAFPTYGNLIADAQGDLYGTTSGDGLGGTAFELAPDGILTVLYTFCTIQPYCADGNGPSAGLISDSQGNLYGTTVNGGGDGCYNGEGCGVVFKLAPDGVETVLHAFTGGADGAQPWDTLLMDAKGNLYGTTANGGGSGCSDIYQTGCGTIFRIAPDGTETVLYSFTGGSDGASPLAGLVADKKGDLYGTAYLGGTYNNGTVYELKK